MIVTVTPNTCLDRMLFVPSFELNKTIRVSRTVMSMAGKPADASWILGELGIPTLAMGFAAGLFGKKMETMLRERGATTDFVWVEGDTRVNTLVVCEDGSGETTFSSSTLRVSAKHVDALLEQYREVLDNATCVIAGGSLPHSVAPTFYADLIREARSRAIPVVFDSSGEGLQAGLKAQPTVIKPNRAELEVLSGQLISSLETAYQAAQHIQEQYGVSLVVTLGKEGALAILPDHAYWIPPPAVKVVSAAGAGDGVLAGLATAFSQGKPFEEGLRLGFAAAGAVCLTPGTADCSRADVERLLPTIELVPYNPRQVLDS